ncbi:MAG: hypothetical protein ACREOO_05930 [bacterium]
MLLRYTFAWTILVIAAILNGFLREAVYKNFLNELSAHQLSTLTAMILFSIIVLRLIS